MATTRKKKAAAQMQAPQDMPPEMAAAMSQGSFKRGGTVKRTGTYKLHKGERVVPAKRGRK